jgi:prophage regulatory protein
MTLPETKRLLRTTEVASRTGLSRTTLWRMEREGTFPKRLRLGSNSIGWVEAEVGEWIDSRPRGMAAPNLPT